MPGAPSTRAWTSPPPEASAACRAAVTASNATLRSSPPRVSANANVTAISQHLGFGPEPPHQLGHRLGALADEARARALGRQRHRLDGHASFTERGGPGLQWPLLCGHDPPW